VPHQDVPAAGPLASTSRLADTVSIVSDFGAVWIAVSLAQVLTRRSTLRHAARRLGVAGVASLVLTRWLKHRYAVPRAESSTSSIARAPVSERFPSGHTLAAFTAALTVPRRPAGRAVALTFAALVAWARVRVGHHETVDVIAGAAVGTLAGSAISAVLATMPGS